jgi:hypothetical protein
MKLNLTPVARQFHLTTRSDTFESTCTSVNAMASFMVLLAGSPDTTYRLITTNPGFQLQRTYHIT